MIDDSKPTTRPENDPLWYKDAIVYQLHVKAFFDSNNDGIGDFRGLTEKLDYLQDLGVNTLWLLPFYPSPLRDDGYDIADYYNINPSYGDIKVFKKLIGEAHKRGLKVMDSTAISLCRDNDMPILVFDMTDPDNIVRAARGEDVGTLVS